MTPLKWAVNTVCESSSSSSNIIFLALLLPLLQASLQQDRAWQLPLTGSHGQDALRGNPDAIPERSDDHVALGFAVERLAVYPEVVAVLVHELTAVSVHDLEAVRAALLFGLEQEQQRLSLLLTDSLLLFGLVLNRHVPLRMTYMVLSNTDTPDITYET